MNESKPYIIPQDLSDFTGKYYIDRMWEEYHKLKEELANTKSKLAQAEDEIDLWKNKWVDATVEAAKFRGCVSKMIPLVEAAKELECSHPDVSIIKKVRRGYRIIEDTWEDVRARCS